MFIKGDYESYFEQIAHVERKMVYGVYELARQIEDPAITGALNKIGDDEVRHYGYVLKMLEVTKDPARPEHRREPRTYCLGMIRLRKIEDEAGEVGARCVNLSANGICLESAEALLPGSAWELEIRFFDKNEVIGRHGRVVWCKEVETGLFMSGIEFRS
jgi:hypothetical protein